MTETTSPTLRRFLPAPRVLRFAVVGAFNTIADITLFYLLHRLTGLIILSNVISYGLTMLVSFILNRSWTFRDTNDGGKTGRKLLQFILLNAATLSLSTVLVYLLSLLLPPVMAKAASVVVTAVVSYLGMRYLIFRPSD